MAAAPDGPSTAELVLPTEAVKSDTVLFWIERSKNLNIVVYEAKKSDGSEEWDSIDGYWLDIDPAYMKKSRAKGKMDDRSELNYLEKTMAYGFTVTPSEAGIKVTLVSLPKKSMALVTTADGLPKVEAVIKGTKCYLRKVFVQAKDSWGLPKVAYVDVFGHSVESGEVVSERITQ